MAEAILHIKDGYYFEVPKVLWRQNYQALDDVPEFLREAHPHASLADFNHAMDGKILIPQPFATLKNLHDKESGFAISKFMIIELVAAVLLVVMFTWLAKRISSGEPPKGKFANLLETFLVFLRDEVARPAIGKHDADRFLPLLWTMFFFILFLNLFGLIPWAGSPTGAWAVTLAMAIVTLGTVFVSGTARFGPIGFWKNQVPHMDLPWYLVWLKLPIFVIEVGGMLIRHGVLSVRLLANMVAGHLVLLAILGLSSEAASASTGTWLSVSLISIVASTLFSVLELFVAFLQAYIFTFLSALFIGAAVHHH